MSRDASGTYTAPSNSFNPAVEGATIDEGDWNTTLDDIEAALTDSLSVSGKGKITAHIDFDETTVSSPAANVGRLYSKDVGGVTSLFFKDNAGTDTNLLLSSPGLAYTFSTSTTMGADPGNGIIRFNNATLASVTAISIDDLDANGADLSTYVLTWDDVGTTDRGTLVIQNRTSPGNVVIFTINGASTDNAGWTQLSVTYVTSAGSFASNAPLGVTFSKPGAGVAGAAGTDPGIKWSFESSTTMAAPTAGYLRLNNATFSSVTAAAVSASSGETGNPSVLAFLQALDDSTTLAHRGLIFIKKISAPQNFAIYDITGALTDNTTWVQLALTHVTSSGSFSASDTLSFQFFRTGDSGGGSGDVVGPAASVDSELALYNSTTGKLIKRASMTGLVKAASGVASAATAGTDYMHPGTTSLITVGFTVTPNNIGTVSSGTTTPAAASGNYAYYTNNGAHTLAAPAADCAIDILVTNGASAGAITFSGFTVGANTGDALTTTNTNKFIISIRRINSVATYLIKALQ